MNQTTNLGFETDVANPNFAGPKDPDAALSVEFYMDNPVDKWATDKKSVEEGRYCEVLKHKEKEAYVRIMRPGDQTTLIVQKVREDHKRRFAPHWLRFQMDHGLIEAQVIGGWKIEDWNYLNADQIHDLKHLRFHTVEQIAAADDIAVQGMGIMGPGLRIQAKKALSETLQIQIKENNEAKDKEISDLKEEMKELRNLVSKKK